MKLPKQIWQNKVNIYLFNGDGRYKDHIQRKDKKLIRKIKRNIIKEDTRKELREYEIMENNIC